MQVVAYGSEASARRAGEFYPSLVLVTLTAGVELVEEVWVIDVEFMRVDKDNRACKYELQGQALRDSKL